MSASQPLIDASPADLVEKERHLAAARANAAARREAIFKSLAILVPFVIVLALLIALVPNFLSESNVRNILINAAVLAITGFGMTYVIALRGIDLSVGSTQALIACVTAMAVNAYGGPVGVVIALLVAAVLGLFNGFIVTTLRVPAFVATLGTLSIFRGAVLILTAGAPILINRAGFKSVGIGQIGPLPIPFLIALAIGILAWFILERTKFGKHLVAVGGRPEAASESGINVQRITVLTFTFAALCAGMAGIVLASQLGVANGSLSAGLELQAIAIVVLGGTSMAGGRGNIVGTFLAAILLAMINSGLNLLNVQSFYQYVALGGLLIFALSLDGIRTILVRRAEERSLA